MSKPVVSIVMGSDSDLEIMQEAGKALEGFGIGYEIDVTSAHRSPDRTADYLLFLSVSATANAGLAYDRLSIVGQGMHTLTAAMLLGRAVPLIVLWWTARTTPEADVAIA
jgi:hypothetical protein